MSKVSPVPKKSKRKSSRVRLPTPPPDPRYEGGHGGTNEGGPNEAGTNEGGTKDAEFLEYLDLLQRNSQRSAFAPAIAAEDAFDHLDKLYRLMEQMLTLREQNVLLHRRIMDLERLRHSQRLDEPPKSKKTRNQSLSDGLVRTRLYERRVSLPCDKPSKVSKWTKVKAAFKWERASGSVSDAKSQDSGLGGLHQVNYELARYLRVPSTSEELGASPADSGTAEISTPATLSSASSIEDLHKQGRRGGKRSRGERRHQDDSSDEEQLFNYEYIPNAKDEASSSKSPSIKSHKTPWAKMKDIIQTQTRNSLRKTHKLSFSYNISDNEDAFETDVESKSPILIVQSPEEINEENLAMSIEHNIPVDVIARYRVISEESNEKHVSKWDKVKKAFLTSPSISRNDSSSPINLDPSPTNKAGNDERLHAEIQKNYLQLQQKLSLEFQDKIQEWERNKLSSPSTSVSSGTQVSSSIDDKENAFKKKMEEWEKIKGGQPRQTAQLQSEENLPPEFRKKLEEWKRIKKSSVKEDGAKKKIWRSVDNQQLSDEFIKRYEAWKLIKGEDGDGRGSFKTPSPGLGRKEGSKKIKEQVGKELQWFEKELGKIEREKQRLERDRQKFLDREERLSKLKKGVAGNAKKEILVHTPSGYYRFEGISRKFTRKLYEWEKAQGIGPEESTFTLLNSSCIPQIANKDEFSPAPLTRSKSADSFMNADVCPLLSQQPSSLSLNDVENLEKDILLESSSVADIACSRENVDSEEPEALIVEVEDVVEETASVLDNHMEQHFAVYQKQEYLCEGETKAAPTVRRSESAKAQANYNLIEQVVASISALLENEESIATIEERKLSQDTIIILNCEDDDAATLKIKQRRQKKLSGALLEGLSKLHEANLTVTSDLSKFEDVADAIHDLSMEVQALAEAIDDRIYKRNKCQSESDAVISTRQQYPCIRENLELLRDKVLEMRRNLSYICAASDMSMSSWKHKSATAERKRSVFRKSRSKEAVHESSHENKYEKHQSPKTDFHRQVEQGAIKKRIRYKQSKGSQSRTLEDTDEEEEPFVEQRKVKPRRMRSQNSTESAKGAEVVEVDPGLVEKVVVPTRTTNFLNFDDGGDAKVQDSPVTVFVKTTTKLFAPIAGTPEASVPASPQRKEISPNIRLMVVRYNQKISEETATAKSAGSSGSASPVAWRSPVLERRVKAQTERYQEELRKMSPLLGGRREVQKSASAGVVTSGNKQVTIPRKLDGGILKSSSVGVVPATIPEVEVAPDSRSERIKRAKEEFLSSPPPSAPVMRNTSDRLKYPAKNRLSQISVESESSSTTEGLLVKSASAGMINVNPEAYKPFDPVDGYVSLPRTSKKEGLLSNITSKFRKVKMRRHKMNTVSALCRQSLIVDIHSQESLAAKASSSAETSPTTSRSGSWIRRFKPKQ